MEIQLPNPALILLIGPSGASTTLYAEVPSTRPDVSWEAMGLVVLASVVFSCIDRRMSVFS